MSSTRLTILSSGISLKEKYEKELLLHSLAGETKRRKRLLKVAVWNVNNKDKFSNQIMEKYIYFVVSAYKKFGIDIMIIFNANFTDRLNWYGYNFMRFEFVTLLWIQNIILRPKLIDNIIRIAEIKVYISLNRGINNDVIELSQIEKGIMNSIKSKDLLIGLYNDAIFKYIKANKRNVVDNNLVNIIGKVMGYCKIISTPYNLESIFVFQICRELECNIGVRLSKIKGNNTIKDIGRILDGSKPRTWPSIKKSFNWNVLYGELKTMSHLMGKVMENQLAPIYKRWNGVWTIFRKEPFLGSSLPDSVIFSYKILLGDSQDKKYELVDIPRGVDTGTFRKEIMKEAFRDVKGGLNEDRRLKILTSQIRSAKSEAGNFDLYKIKDIVDGLKKWIKDRGRIAVRGGKSNQNFIRSLLRRVINLLNIEATRQIMVTFFLLKNIKLQTASDTRMIAIAPTLIKIFEVIIYKEVIQEAEKIMAKDEDNWQYQYGARHNSSTTKAMIEVRERVSNFGAKGIIALDIRKGYESVSFDKLKLAVKHFVGYGDLRLRFLLLSWVVFVQNLNVMVSGIVIRKTCGIPMGLMLSPLMFVVYVHYLLRNLDSWFRRNLFMYIDDIILILDNNQDVEREAITGIVTSVQKVNTIVDALAKGNLFINFDKANLITNSNILMEQMLRVYPNIKAGGVLKYLGREIMLKGELLLQVNPNIDKGFFALLRQVPYWAPLIIRIAVFNGGLESNSRYQALMWEISVECKRNLFYRAKTFYSLAFEKLTDIEVLFILGNYFRLSWNAFYVKQWFFNSEGDKSYIQAVSEQKKMDRMKAIKEAMKFGVSSLDEVTNEHFDEWFSYEMVANMADEADNYWDAWLSISNFLWVKFRQMILMEYWIEECNPKNRKDLDKESDNCFSWNKLFCWLIGIFDKFGNPIQFTLVKRFAILLDMIFLYFDNDKLLSVLHILDEHLIKMVNLIIINESMGELKLDININMVMDLDQETITNRLISKIVLIDVIGGKGFEKINESSTWKGIFILAGKEFCKIADLLNRQIATRNLTLDQIHKENKRIKKAFKALRRKTIKILLIIDSVYKDNVIERKDVYDILTYIEVMGMLYKEELEKQIQIFESAEYYIEDKRKLAIDSNLELNYIETLKNQDSMNA